MAVIRCLTRIGLLALLLSIAPAAALATPASQQSRAERDSVAALNRVETARTVFKIRFVDLLRYFTQRLVIWRNRDPAELGNAFAAAMPQGYCEQRVGDFCHGPANGGLKLGLFGNEIMNPFLSPARFPRVNKPLLMRFKSQLLRDIDRAIEKAPSDSSAIGEKVFLLVESGQYPDAIDAAHGCRSTPWWCNALRGFVFHYMKEYWIADSLWRVSLAQMPEESRCDWLDPSSLIDDGAVRRRLMESSCAQRTKLSERYWMLADPLWSDNYNERLSEQFYRRVYNSEFQDWSDVNDSVGRIISDTTWRRMVSPQLRSYDLLVDRFGVPQNLAMSDNDQNLEFLALYELPRVQFTPVAAIALDVTAARAEDWELHPLVLRESMAGYERTIFDMPAQVGFFRRDGAASIVVASGDNDTPKADPSAAAFLFLRDSTGAVQSRDVRQPEAVVRFLAGGRLERTLFGVELAGVRGRTGRTRFGAGPPVQPEQRVQTSDVLLLEGSTLAADLDAAAARARGSTVVTDSAIALFWEVYGLEAGDHVRTSIVVTEDGAGFLGRVAQALLGGRPASVAVVWTDQSVTSSTITPKSIVLGLSDLPPGRYRMLLRTEVDGQLPVEAERTIDVARVQRRH